MVCIVRLFEISAAPDSGRKAPREKLNRGSRETTIEFVALQNSLGLGRQAMGVNP
jgi:hypothetical protein